MSVIHEGRFGEPNAGRKRHYTSPLKDLSLREVSILMICVIGLLWLGLYPQTFLDVSHSSMQWLVNSYMPVQEVVETVQQTATQLEHVEMQ